LEETRLSRPADTLRVLVLAAGFRIGQENSDTTAGGEKLVLEF